MCYFMSKGEKKKKIIRIRDTGDNNAEYVVKEKEEDEQKD
jgi:hypothetical protein